MTEKIRAVFDKCLQITGSFEGASWGGTVGNFDGQGMSAFVLQWNLGQRTLQPLLMAMLNADEQKFKSCFTSDQLVRLIAMLRSGDRSMEQDFIHTITTGRDEDHPGLPFPTGKRDIQPEWKGAFSALGHGFKQQQRDAALPYFTDALLDAQQFGMKTERAIVYLFDQSVQRGKHSLNDELKDAQADVNAFSVHTDYIKMRMLLDWDLPDFREKFRADVESRRMCIIEGKGRVHNRERDLSAEYGLSDTPILT